MYDDLQKAPDEFPTWSKPTSFFPKRKIYFLSLLMPNYQLFVPLHLSNIIYIKKRAKSQALLWFYSNCCFPGADCIHSPQMSTVQIYLLW